MYRALGRQIEVFLAHPGGPFFRGREQDCWTIPKGEVELNEGRLEAAIREFREEVGIEPQGPFLPLGSIRQKSGKVVYGWAFEGDWDEDQPIQSSTFEVEWPPRSGRKQKFPEVDKARFFTLSQALPRLKEAQHPFLDRLHILLARKLAESRMD